MWSARADAPDTAPAEAERLRADAAAARAEAAHLAEQITQLEAIDEARAVWFAHTAVTRDNADRSRVELKARGVDLDRPSDRTTGSEWLALHRAEQADRERDQPVTELDVPDAEHETAEQQQDARDREDEPRTDDQPAELIEPETAVPDLREISTPDPTETADPSRNHSGLGSVILRRVGA